MIYAAVVGAVVLAGCWTWDHSTSIAVRDPHGVRLFDQHGTELLPPGTVATVELVTRESQDPDLPEMRGTLVRRDDGTVEAELGKTHGFVVPSVARFGAWSFSAPPGELFEAGRTGTATIEIPLEVNETVYRRDSRVSVWWTGHATTSLANVEIREHRAIHDSPPSWTFLSLYGAAGIGFVIAGVLVQNGTIDIADSSRTRTAIGVGSIVLGAALVVGTGYGITWRGAAAFGRFDRPYSPTSSVRARSIYQVAY
jgi:hypothetical protein